MQEAIGKRGEALGDWWAGISSFCTHNPSQGGTVIVFYEADEVMGAEVSRRSLERRDS